MKHLFWPQRVLKKKKLKINVPRPVGTRVKYDDEGNVIPPLAALVDTERGDSVLEPEKVKERYEKLWEEMKQVNKEDKDLQRQRLREKQTKEKMKLKRWRKEGGEEEDDCSEEDGEARNKVPKRSKIYFDSDNYEDEQKSSEKKDVGFIGDSISIAEQEALALKL